MGAYLIRDPNGLEYFFSNASYQRLLAAEAGDASAVLSASNATVAPFADEFLEYDAQQRVTELVSQGDGCSVCSGGLGTFTYSYSESTNPPGMNNWATKTVETLSNGTENIIYSNSVSFGASKPASESALSKPAKKVESSSESL